MRPVSAGELLAAWELGRGRGPQEKALALLRAACPETPGEVLADLPLGERDRRLLRLREQVFGPRLTGVAACPGCGERWEVDLGTAELGLEPEGGGGAPPDTPILCQHDGYALTLRLPTGRDLIAAGQAPDLRAAREVLRDRCIVSARQGADTVAMGDLPPEVVAAAMARLAQADPQADVQLALTCPACTHHWQVTFDIATFLWTELQAWGERLLRQVHVLARAYGWREADILALSPWRRQFYLEMVGS